MKHAVFFVTIIELDDELFVDDMFFGGIVEDKDKADLLARDIINDNGIQGAIVPKVLPLVDNLSKAMEIANKYFVRMRNEIYDTETRRKSKDLSKKQA
jgi:hypothetical protein